VHGSIPISIGDIVTFSFDNQRRQDLPVCPKIERIRTDLLWDDVVSSFAQEKQYINGTYEGWLAEVLGTNDGSANTMLNDGYTKSMRNNWTPNQMRNILESFAKSGSMDPQVPATWHVIRDAIHKSKVRYIVACARKRKVIIVIVWKSYYSKS
jgi:hypothetical protein